MLSYEILRTVAISLLGSRSCKGELKCGNPKEKSFGSRLIAALTPALLLVIRHELFYRRYAGENFELIILKPF